VTARIRRGAQFGTFAAGTRRRRGPLAMTAAPSLDPGVPRIGYAIGRATGPAVVRNRLRRRLRAAAAAAGPNFDDTQAYLISATKGATSLTYREIEASVATLARELAGAVRA
jgi:ribonuclease P protein component